VSLFRWFFLLFFVSGFCSLVYQVVWLRLAMTAFGVTTPMVSTVLSVFMAGLAVGSWLAGSVARSPRIAGSLRRPLRLYALAELVIALSGSLAPALLENGRRVVGASGTWGAWDSAGYYVAAGSWVALSLLPFCVAMGATLPLAMAALRAQAPLQAHRSFSWLYVANVGGAAAGTLVTALALVELLGFRGTLAFAASLNAGLSGAALLLSLRLGEPAGLPAASAAASEAAALVTDRAAAPARAAARPAAVALFWTGFTSLAAEVVWVRLYTPYLGTVVYAFALILTVYLVATLAGSSIYRRLDRPPGRVTAPGAWIFCLAAVSVLLPAVAANPMLFQHGGLPAGGLRVLFGIAPFCALLGFVTPMLVDRWSGGDPQVAGRAYALNVVGSILGPLAAGFVLLPRLSEPAALLVLAVPLAALGTLSFGAAPAFPPSSRKARAPAFGFAIAAGGAAMLATHPLEDVIPGAVVRRDHTATVVAFGQGRDRQLLVNGVPMTTLTPITKMMAHLPLAQLGHAPRRGLVLCLGMGTSFRSMLSWQVDTTAVELVPSVAGLLGFYFADGPALLASGRGRIVVDDARRFLDWSPDAFDVIVVDPPPPIEAAGTSLLYSREFFEAARRRLRPGGILQHWLPSDDGVVQAGIAQALAQSFPHARAFRSVEGWGMHFLASDAEIPRRSAAELLARMPAQARADLVEWGPSGDPAAMLGAVLGRELPFGELIVPGFPALQDDRPLNEYYLLRRSLRARAN